MAKSRKRRSASPNTGLAPVTDGDAALSRWRAEQQAFALGNLARAYSNEEPEYTLHDVEQ